MLVITCSMFSHLPDNVQVKYRSKVVKYTWPMPHHAAEAVPWVQVMLANGETLQTKLLVSLTPSHKPELFSCPFCLLHLFFSSLYIDWCRWTELNGETGIRDTHCKVELWSIGCGCSAAPIRGGCLIQLSVIPLALLSHMSTSPTFKCQSKAYCILQLQSAEFFLHLKANILVCKCIMCKNKNKK